MKKTYVNPVTDVYAIVGRQHLLENSIQIKVDKTHKVSDTNDIGFTKENSNDYNVWDDDWSK